MHQLTRCLSCAELTSIRYCVQEVRPGLRAQPFALSPRLRGLCALTRCIPHAQTCNFDTLYAYLSTANYDFSYDRAKNLCALPRFEPIQISAALRDTPSDSPPRLSRSVAPSATSRRP